MTRVTWQAIVRVVAGVLLLVWAGFWCWFAVATCIHEGGGWLYAVRFAAPLLLAAGLAWFWPRPGALLLVLGGVFAWFYFDGTAARLMLACPAAVLGVLLALAGRPSRGRREAAGTAAQLPSL